MSLKEKHIFQCALDELDACAVKILPIIQKYSIIALQGTLGAGKTTLTGALLKHLGVQDSVQSPTYTYMNMYTTISGQVVYHFDLYRLQTLQDFVTSGFDEFLHDEQALVLIEWPDIVYPLIQDKACCVSIRYTDNALIREIVVEG